MGKDPQSNYPTSEVESMWGNGELGMAAWE